MLNRPSTITHRQTLLREALAVMHADYATDLTLDDVARTIATSRRQLQRCFAEHARDSFRTTLARIRAARAAEMLRDTELPIATVARRVGYAEPAQVAKAFRRHAGVVPSAYRRAHAGRGGEPQRHPRPYTSRDAAGGRDGNEHAQRAAAAQAVA
jgi:transcriptional regulator GlxA family with amidase domain